MKSLLPLALIFFGETLFIYAEMSIAHVAQNYSQSSNQILTIMGVIALISYAMLLPGYYFGYKSSGNIWLITAVSIGSILITEPIISWSIFHEIPTRGAGVGLVFGVLGILATLIL